MGRTGDTVTVKPEALVPEHLEFPRFNYKLVGQKNQFFYALGNDYLHPNRVI
jgi:carotenoid cleavage dioxygenase-like enzyme